MEVTSKDLISSNQYVQPFHGYNERDAISICKLSSGQRIKLRATAKKGIGKDHSKWTPVCVATYTFEPIIRLNWPSLEELKPEEKEAFVNSCPTRVYSYDPQQEKVDIENANACIFCQECVKQANRMNKHDLVHISPSFDKYYFSVETNGSLRPEEVVLAAIEIIQDKLQTVEGHLNADSY